jgi:excisionase family DNA binding protein
MKKYISAPKVARLLDLPLWRVYELCRLRVLPHARLRRQIRIDPERLKAFMDAGGAPLTPKSNGSWRGTQRSDLL